MDRLIVVSVLVAAAAVAAFFYLVPFEQGGDVAIALCEGKPSEVDLQMLERYSEITALFSNHADNIWNRNYHLGQVPLFVVYGELGQKAAYGYIFNHPDIKAVENVCLMPQIYDNLPEVYKQTQIPEDNPISIPIFNFDFDLGGVSHMLVSYTPGITFFDPALFDWILFVSHEAFHQYQGRTWEWAELGQRLDTENYPVDADHIALVLLEQEILQSAFTAPESDMRDEALKQFYAVRTARLQANPGLQDTNKEHIEGAARYIEHRIVEITERAPVRFSRNAPEEPLKILSSDGMRFNVRMLLSFNRLYATGAVLGLMLDDMGFDWQLPMDGGMTFLDHLQTHFAITEDELPGLMDAAKAAHDFDQLRFWAEGVAELADAQADQPAFSPASPAANPYPYELPAEQADINLSLDPEALPEHLGVEGTYITNAEALDPAEAFLYSTDGEAIEVVALGSGPNENRIHASPTSYTSLDDWFENEVKQSKRMPVVDLQVIDGLQYGVTYGNNTSFIFLMDGALVHIFGRASLEEKLAISRSMLNP